MTMASEIERRWLVNDPPTQEVMAYHAMEIEQFYLQHDPASPGLRLRKATADGQSTYFMTTKRAVTAMTNEEVEIIVPAEIWEAVRPFASRGLTKLRRTMPHGGLLIELDVFTGGANPGLMIAEIELASEDTEVIVPDWFGPEITGQRGYTNYQMATPI